MHIIVEKFFNNIIKLITTSHHEDFDSTSCLVRISNYIMLRVELIEQINLHNLIKTYIDFKKISRHSCFFILQVEIIIFLMNLD